MPKRTNDFQTLIKHIYEQIVPAGGVVTESGMLHDRDSGELREVDILVSYKYAGHEFSFIVECRDHTRPQCVEWIDSLIGKSKSLGVNKVVAVSRNGFYKPAIKKAKENGIETFTLEEANEKHWGEIPFKPGVLLITSETYQIQQVFYEKDGLFIPITKLDFEKDTNFNSENTGNIKELVEYFFKEFVVPEIEKYKNENYLELFKTKEDANKIFIAENEYNWPELNAFDKQGNKVSFSKVKFVVSGTRKTADVPQQHKAFNDKTLSIGEFTSSDGSAFKSLIVQDPDTRKINIQWQKTNKQA